MMHEWLTGPATVQDVIVVMIVLSLLADACRAAGRATYTALRKRAHKRLVEQAMREWRA